MNREKLKLFIKLAETGNYNRTAEQCHVSASKLSRVIQALEQELKVPLFERDNRHVALTPQGHRLLNFAREQLQQWETFHEGLLADAGELSGSVSIYCSVTASYSFLYDILSEFRRLHPLIQIQLHTGDPAAAIERVSSGQEDLAIAAKPERMPGNLSFRQFASSPLVFIRASEDVRFETLLETRGQLAWPQIPMIVSERGLARLRFNAWVAAQQFNPNIYSQVSGNEAIVSMVSLGSGLGLVPKIVVDNSPLQNRVSLFSVQPDIAAYEIGACVQSRRLKSPLVRALWEVITTRRNSET